MANHSKETYTQMFDQMLSQELTFNSSAATPANIKNSMKRILGSCIRTKLIKRYSSLVLDENLNVHFTIVDEDSTEFAIELVYGQ